MRNTELLEAAGKAGEKKRKTFFRDVVSRFIRHRLAAASAAILLAEILLLLLLPLVLELAPNEIDYAAFEAAPSSAHWLGTDDVGRDVFARLIYGGRVSLAVGFGATLISVLIGVPLGMLAGYYRGIPEIIIIRLSEVFLSIPSTILILVIVSITGTSVVMLTLVIGVMGWPGIAKLMYGSVLSAREKEYVEAARAIGEKDHVIQLKYILPNTITPVLTAFTFRVAGAILQESGLSFLGLGVQTPQASWGNILNSAQSVAVLTYRPWRWVPAGLILLITVSAINFIGDGLRDAMDVSHYN